MARQSMNNDDPLVPKQISIPVTMRARLRRASMVSGKSEAQIVRDALAVELERDEYKEST